MKLEQVTDNDIENGTYEIEEGITEIGEQAFYDCTSLTKISLPKSVTKIGARAFRGCTNLVNIMMPESVKEVENSAFRDCMDLTEIVLPKNVTRIRSGAFWGCTSLSSLILPEDIVEIGKDVFCGCEKLIEERIKKQEYVTILDYQIITGACKKEVEKFLKKSHFSRNSKMSIKEMIELTKGEYGNERFQKIWKS